MTKAKNWYRLAPAVALRRVEHLHHDARLQGDHMRNRLVILTIALIAVLIFSLVMVAQYRGGGQGRGNAAPPTRDTRPFDAKDLAGIWSRNSNGYGGSGTCRECGDRGFGNSVPAFTPLGQKMFDANKPSYGRALG